jgi:hypothetical protein
VLGILAHFMAWVVWYWLKGACLERHLHSEAHDTSLGQQHCMSKDGSKEAAAEASKVMKVMKAKKAKTAWKWKPLEVLLSCLLGNSQGLFQFVTTCILAHACGPKLCAWIWSRVMVGIHA